MNARHLNLRSPFDTALDKPSGGAVAGLTMAAIAVAALVVLAARADSQLPRANTSRTAIDLAVGLVFILVAAVAPGSLVKRGLVSAVGASWLVGSFAPTLQLLHQGFLLILLATFSATRRRFGVTSWILVILAVPVGGELISRPAVGVVFAGTAATMVVMPRAHPVAWYPAIASAGVATVLVLSAILVPNVFDLRLSLLTYQTILLLVAVGFLVASRALTASRAKLADHFLGDDEFTGLDGFSAVLGEALGDRDLRVYLSDGVESGDGSRRRLHVDDGGKPLAVVVHRSSALDDASTVSAVSSAVRLAVSHLLLQQQLERQLDDLQLARGRIVAAVDRQRTAMVARLREDVVAPLLHATRELCAMRATLQNGEPAQALDVVLQELESAAGDIVALAVGVPSVPLGDGRLSSAVEALAGTSPVPVTVIATDDARGDTATETTLFYVCTEALVNALKHASCSRVDIAITADAATMAVSISDDGCGGADATGSGLRGLADRLASCGGRLRLDSQPGAGTTLTATIPHRTTQTAT